MDLPPPSIVDASEQDVGSPNTEEKELIRFERAEAYLLLLHQLVRSPTTSAQRVNVQQKPHDVLTALLSILDEYQGESHLLDPYLDSIVRPPVEALQRHIKATSSATPLSDVAEVQALSTLVYTYTKIRGYKTITHFFPHEVDDLPAILSFLERLMPENSSADPAPGSTDDARALAQCWELRYVALLWLSLICMIPFDLAKFDAAHVGQASESTVKRIQAVGLAFILSPGKERDAAAVLLGKLFQRQEVIKVHFTDFVNYGLAILRTDKPSSFAATGILQALCEIVKVSDPIVVTQYEGLIQIVRDAYDERGHGSLLNNALVLKYRTKLVGRVALKLLRPRKRARFVHVKTLGASESQSNASITTPDNDDEEEDDVPEVIEGHISELIEALQHKDTLVRYSAAKGLARLCDRLPTSFVAQVSDAIVSLFEIGIPDLYEGANDLSSVSEHTWQGTCMALAELARRGLLLSDGLGEKLRWIEKALLYDVRRGAHSIGANVRDSACYVVWALARAHDAKAMEASALSLANKLVCVATLDREVSVRRAASASFQESVGRLDLFPHGLEVIRLTDFYAVSVRRNAFLQCAVQVADMEEYRDYITYHLLHVTILHWDPQMRILGAKALALIVIRDLKVQTAMAIGRLQQLLHTTDTTVLHGALLSLAEICEQCRQYQGEEKSLADSVRSAALDLLEIVPDDIFSSTGAPAILVAASQLIGSSISSSTPCSPGDNCKWQRILNIASRRPEEAVEIAAATALGQASLVLDLSPKLRSILSAWTSLTLAEQQSSSLALGRIDYVRHTTSFEIVIRHLIGLTIRQSPALVPSLYSSNIETRRNAIDSIATAIVGLGPEVANTCTASVINYVLEAMLKGLEDYTADQRGDVGSWVRMSCISGIRSILVHLHVHKLHEWVPQDLFSSAIAGLWKQAAERIDHIRQMAAFSAMAVYRQYSGCDMPSTLGYQSVETLLHPSLNETKLDFKDPKAAYPFLISMLQVSAYRKAILEGIVVSVGSKSDLGDRVIGPVFADFLASQDEAVSVPVGEAYTVEIFLQEVFQLGKKNFSNNRVFIPSLQTVSLVIENGLLETHVPEARERDLLLRLLKMAVTGMRNPKHVPRVVAAAVLLVNAFPIFYGSNEMVLDSLGDLLSHVFPVVRGKVAEHLYFVLSSSSTIASEASDVEGNWEQLEILLLDTNWTSVKRDHFRPEAEQVIKLLQSMPTRQA